MAGNFLDPAAQEFHPALCPAQFSLLPPPPIYYPYGAPPAPAVPVPFYQSAQLNPSPYVSPAAALPDTKPSRSLLLSSVPPHTTESAVRVEMEAFGGVRAVEMGRLHGEGLVTVHFYDLRSAQAALAEIREQHVRQQSLLGQQYGFVGMVPDSSSASGLSTSTNWAGGGTPLWAELGGGCSSSVGGYCGGGQVVVGRGLIAGRAVWAQFAPEAAGLDGPNNGSLVVFNLDSDVSSAALKEVFQVFGAVKELRETPLKPRHRFVEFFDIRDAARALYELNGKEIFGKRVVIEFSRPGGQQARSYCRKGSAHQPTPLPPRLLRLPRTTSSSTNRSSSLSGGTPRSPPTPSVGFECSILTHEEAAADKSSSARRGKSRSAASSSGAVSSSRHQSGRHKGWKNPGGKSRTAAEARFLIKEAAAAAAAAAGDAPSSSSCRDTRTTVMIKNIPNKYSQKLLLNMLDNHCIHCNERIAAGGDGREPVSSYDFVYLPIDFNNKCNVGYGFVNLTSPEATWRLYRAFHMQPWEVFNSRKICQVTYARLQGLEALKEHFRNSKFACDTDEYMPVVFSPPRDGKTLTAPASIGSRGGSAVLTAAGKRKMAALMEEIGAPLSDDQPPTDGGGCSSPSTTASTLPPSDQVEEEEGERSCGTAGGNDACDDDDNEGWVEGGGGGGGVGDMTDLTETLRHHHL